MGPGTEHSALSLHIVTMFAFRLGTQGSGKLVDVGYSVIELALRNDLAELTSWEFHARGE